jgi:inosine triphosphate pyrophosphatase
LGESWRVLDVTTAMAYALLTSYGKGKRSISAACAILRGFHHNYPLTPDERKHLRLLMTCRLAMSAIMGAYSYKQNPENQYLLLHSKPAWDALHLIWGVDGKGQNGKTAEVVEEAFSIACDDIHVSDDSRVPDSMDISFSDPPIADPFASARYHDSSKNITPNDSLDIEQIVAFVTGNKRKAEEVERILSAGGGLPFTLTNYKIDLPELQGDPILVAKEKCSLASKHINGAVITEDTSLCFNALNGMPGIYVKWFLEKNGLDGLNDMLSFSEDKSGYAQTVVAFCAGPGKEVLTFVGKTHGKIVRPRGALDFGWDPIFEPDGSGLTYAEMTGDQKDSISHRKRAFVKLSEYIKHKYNKI